MKRKKVSFFASHNCQAHTKKNDNKLPAKAILFIHPIKEMHLKFTLISSRIIRNISRLKYTFEIKRVLKLVFKFSLIEFNVCYLYFATKFLVLIKAPNQSNIYNEQQRLTKKWKRINVTQV